MATADQIAQLRLMINEPNNVLPYTDAVLGAAIDLAAGDLNSVAYDIWTTKAAGVANLVDISEGGSSRKMGDLYEQYLSMANTFGSRRVDVAADAVRGMRISKIRR